jgi:hypothetical protein
MPGEVRVGVSAGSVVTIALNVGRRIEVAGAGMRRPVGSLLGRVSGSKVGVNGRCGCPIGPWRWLESDGPAIPRCDGPDSGPLAAVGA